MYAGQHPAFISYRSEALLAGTDLKLFRNLSHNPKSREYAYFGGFQKITAELYKSNPEPPTLTYINSDGRIYCNFYVLGVILRKMNFLMPFVFPNKDGLIKDYRQVVGEWLGKPNILEEISRENEAAIQGEKAGLEKLLKASLQRELTDKSFDPIRAAIINAHRPHVLRPFQSHVGKIGNPDIAAETPQNSRPMDAKTKKHPRKKKGHKGRRHILRMCPA